MMKKSRVSGLQGRFIAQIYSLSRMPRVWLLIAAFALYITGINWGLPSSEDWLSDSLAPFHPLLGLMKGFSFGYLHKYPLVHQFILAILNLPVVIAALVKSDPSNGVSLFELVNTLRSPSYASALILIDRLVSVAMALGIIHYVYKITRELFNDRAALIASAIVLCNGVLCSYAHMAKVEVPYLFWAMLALLYLVRSVKYSLVSDHIKCALFIALCIGTKDQGYALFILPVLLYLVVWTFVFRKSEFSDVRSFLKGKLFLFGIVSLLSIVVTQNLVLNWEGFVYRFGILTGWNGVRSKAFAPTLEGDVALFIDSAFIMISSGAITVPFYIASLSGIALLIYSLVRRKNMTRTFVRLLPFVSMVSYYLFFVQIIKQTNPRFSLPQSVLLPVYAGYFFDFLLAKVSGVKKQAVYAVLALITVFSLYESVSVSANYTDDLRYEAENWMDSNVPDGTHVEYYGYLHYEPRYTSRFTAYRVTARPFDLNKRNPDYIVLTSHYYPRFIKEKNYTTQSGRIMTTEKEKTFIESEFADYIPRLLNGELGYRRAAYFEKRQKWYKYVKYSRISPDHIIILERDALSVQPERKDAP